MILISWYSYQNNKRHGKMNKFDQWRAIIYMCVWRTSWSQTACHVTLGNPCNNVCAEWDGTAECYRRPCSMMSAHKEPWGLRGRPPWEHMHTHIHAHSFQVSITDILSHAHHHILYRGSTVTTNNKIVKLLKTISVLLNTNPNTKVNSEHVMWNF